MPRARCFARLPLTLFAPLALLACSMGPTLDERGRAPDEHPDLATLERSALVALALEEPAGERRAALVTRLREAGPSGLDALIAEYRSVSRRPTAEDRSWRALIDEVAQQRDAHYGGLFWTRDLTRAQAEAAATGKPILSLRLLGELTSEYSCANSRLFRTLLYADPELAEWLEQTFVLHWSSERPVPRLAIDFGDGRKIERTITGNSAHFVLDAEGRTLDVIPGLLAAGSFRAALGEATALHGELASIRNQARWHESLAAYHERRFIASSTRLVQELARLRGEPQSLAALQMWLGASWEAEPEPGPRRARRNRVPAIDAVPMAIGKARVEAPILAAAPRQLGGRGSLELDELDKLDIDPSAPSERELAQIGASITGEITLHPNSEAIIASERPLDGLVGADEREQAEAALRRALIRSIQADTGKNLFELHARIHIELAARARARASLGFAEVDEWLYAEVFQTPADDPWLGMIDPTVYTGLRDGGLRSN